MARFRYKCTLEYEGTRYSGWQAQPNARTVQGEFNRAVAVSLHQEETISMAAGRTDAGVHALEQTVHFDTDSQVAPHIIELKINDELPHDITVTSTERVDTRFNARTSCHARSYLYVISRRRTAFGKRFVWWVRDNLNSSAMQEAAQYAVGFHDFQSFSADSPADKSTKVDMLALNLTERGSLIELRFAASHFLWKMIRRMVGTLVEVGRGTIPPDKIGEWLRKPSDEPAHFTAPPSGLFFEKAYYDNENPVTYRSKPLLTVA